MTAAVFTLHACSSHVCYRPCTTCGSVFSFINTMFCLVKEIFCCWRGSTELVYVPNIYNLCTYRTEQVCVAFNETRCKRVIITGLKSPLVHACVTSQLE